MKYSGRSCEKKHIFNDFISLLNISGIIGGALQIQFGYFYSLPCRELCIHLGFGFRAKGLSKFYDMFFNYFPKVLVRRALIVELPFLFSGALSDALYHI